MSPEFSRYKEALRETIDRQLEETQAQMEIFNWHIERLEESIHALEQKAINLETAREVVTGLPDLSVSAPDNPDGISLVDFKAVLLNGAFGHTTVILDAEAKLREAGVSSSLPIEVFSPKHAKDAVVSVNGREETIGKNEFKLLEALRKNPNSFQSFGFVARDAGLSYGRGQVALKHLRQRFENDPSSPTIFRSSRRGTGFFPPEDVPSS